MAQAKIEVYRAPLFAKFPWLQHGFGTRLNPGWIGAAATATVRQIHSDRVLEARESGVTGEGDALLTNQPGLMVSIRTADCVPILIADPVHRAVAAVHAGWRGTVSGVVARALESMTERYGTQPDDVHLVLGPAIAACCFEVGPDVAVQFQKLFPERTDLDGRTHIDLIEANRRIARLAGVPEEAIAQAGMCTSCDRENFFSYRREQDSGRMVSAIGIITEGGTA